MLTVRAVSTSAVLRECETRRAQIAKTWFTGQDLSSWTPKCDLVLHPTRASYRTAAGPLSDCTVACCTIDTPADGMTRRRIDVCAVRGDWLDHLPHELTHLLVDGQLTAGDLPRWADEGMALLADPVEKRDAHARDLSRALEDGSQFRLGDLLSLDQYPRDGQVAVFYGQSMAIVEFLVDRGGTEKFAEFVNQACRRGYDVALSTSYGMGSVGELEKQWLAQARNPIAQRTPASVEISKSRNLPDGSAPGNPRARCGAALRRPMDRVGRRMIPGSRAFSSPEVHTTKGTQGRTAGRRGCLCSAMTSTSGAGSMPCA